MSIRYNLELLKIRAQAVREVCDRLLASGEIGGELGDALRRLEDAARDAEEAAR